MDFPRNGAWAIDQEGRVGILISQALPGTPPVLAWEFHVVDDTGTTTLVLPSVPVGQYVQARYREIPAPRREGLSPDRARALGYA